MVRHNGQCRIENVYDYSVKPNYINFCKIKPCSTDRVSVFSSGETRFQIHRVAYCTSKSSRYTGLHEGVWKTELAGLFRMSIVTHRSCPSITNLQRSLKMSSFSLLYWSFLLRFTLWTVTWWRQQGLPK